VTVQAVLQLLGSVEEEALFRLCDLIVDRDTAGTLEFIEGLSEQGQDLGRVVTDLLEHLRHLMVVQHVGDVPESLPVTEEARDRLRAQANQLGEATVLRLCDLLAVAVEDLRQGGEPRLPLELAIVKVTRPASDLSRESLAYRVEQLEERLHPTPVDRAPAEATDASQAQEAAPPSPPIQLVQLREAWQRSVLPAVEERSIPTAAMLREAHPVELEDDTLTLEFPPAAEFHRKLAEEPKNAALVGDALYEVTGRRLSLVFTVGAGERQEADEDPASEAEFVATLKETFDAREIDD
ncbi:MAG: hypothetical protein M3322_05665, partial [Actinomycetota bacterium]|nr:hypothetical protein [Actinomycetota bacterium]